MIAPETMTHRGGSDRIMPASPPALRLGRELKRLREAAGYTSRRAVEQIADNLELSPATIYRIEKGEGLKKEKDVRAMCDLYGANSDRTAALMDLLTQSKAPGWWAEYSDGIIPADLRLYLALEQAADTIWWFEPGFMPGLLQAEDYARTVITEISPGAPEEETAAKIRFRMERRQRVLAREPAPPLLHVVIDEAVIRRTVGGPAVHAAQLDWLHQQAAAMPNVSLRVVPFNVGYHSGLDTGSFELLRFPPDSDGQIYETPTVYHDGGYAGTQYIDSSEEVARYFAAFEGESRNLIKQVAEVTRA
jgi:transcriptional regulator with XRE-family HTH domain